MTHLEERVLTAASLEEFRVWLDDFRNRESTEAHSPPQGLDVIKKDAVQKGDQELASAVWCLEQIIVAQWHFITAYEQARSLHFYGSWCSLEQAEIALHSLSRHYSSPAGRFGVPTMLSCIPKLQALYPYRIFMSPGYIIHEAICSICRQKLQVRGGCGHRRHELYDGEACGRIITKPEMLEISFVEKPVQKYSVAFAQGGPGFNYALVDYAVKGMGSPWADWSYEIQERYRPTALAADERFRSRKRNDRCPCGSHKKFKKCCLSEMRESYQHHQFGFPNDPRRTGLPTFIPKAIVRGVDDGTGGPNRPSLGGELVINDEGVNVHINAE